MIIVNFWSDAEAKPLLAWGCLPAISILVSRKTVVSSTAATEAVVFGALLLLVASDDDVVACFLEDEGLLDPLEEAVEELLDNVGGGGPDDFSILFSLVTQCDGAVFNGDGLRGSRVE